MSSSIHPAVASAIRADETQKTPSWTAIVEAYHREGNNDREMLLALLNAKAKEDERLAALDLLHAEQLRAYTAHITIHGPFSHQLPYHYHSHAQQQAYAHYPSQMHAALPTPPLSSTHPRAHANSTSSASSSSGASTSRTSVSSGSSSSRKVNRSTTSTAKKPRQTKAQQQQQQQQQQQSQSQRDNASRSPSLSHTASESGVSSLDELQTPADERRLSDVSLGLGGVIGTKRKAPAAATEADFIEAFSMAPTTAASAMQHYDEQHQQHQHMERPAKRYSPSAAAPSSSSTEAGHLTQQQQEQAQAQATRQTSPRSLVNILNDDLRPLCLNKYRAATSDLRGSASDEDELA